MPSYHVSSSGKVVKCASDPCKLHNGTDVQANSAEEATKILEEQAAKDNETQAVTGLTAAKNKNPTETAKEPKMGYEIKVSKFDQEVRKRMRLNPEYARLTAQMEAVQAKQVALDEKYDKTAAQIHAARDEYYELDKKRFEVQCALEKNISAELMKNPETAKLVNVYDE